VLDLGARGAFGPYVSAQRERAVPVSLTVISTVPSGPWAVAT
jgi:hypothetical protein